jgi:hypothetical protein
MKLTEDYPFPVNSVDLIDLLAEAYPQRCIQKGEDLIDAHRYAALADLVQELLEMKREYEEGEYAD